MGVVPLLVVGYLRRSLPETSRWANLDEQDRRRGGLLGVFVPPYRFRFLVLVLLAAGASASFATAFSFASYRATTAFQWTPAQVSTMILTGGGLGFWGWMVFGRMADLMGRRPTAAVCLVGSAAAIACFYRTSMLFPAFATLVFFEAGITIAVTAISTESFPTALRATARAWVTNASMIGAVVGLGLVGALSSRLGGSAPVVALLGLLPLVIAPLLWWLPETVGRDLDADDAP